MFPSKNSIRRRCCCRNIEPLVVGEKSFNSNGGGLPLRFTAARPWGEAGLPATFLEVHGMKIVKLSNPESGRQRKLLVAKMAELLLDLLETLGQIEQLHRDERDSDRSSRE